MQNVRQKIKELRQKKGQTVRDINSLLELWERDLSTLFDEEIKVYNIFGALYPDLRHAILIEMYGKITTREQVISIAQRYIERMILDWDEGNGGKFSGKRKRIEGAMQEKDKDDSSFKKKRKIDKRDEKNSKDIVYYNCNESGYKRSDCLNLK